MIIQVNICICDICGKRDVTAAEEDVHSDPVIGLPENWESAKIIPEEFRTHVTNDCCTACAECNAAPDWNRYVARREHMKKSGGSKPLCERIVKLQWAFL